jgi:TP901 family phage tail tape measure protein
MSEFLSEAEVVVRANTKPFLVEFQKAVARAEKVKVTVDIRISTTGFRAQIIQAVERAKRNVFVSVPLRVDPKGFRAALQAQVLASSKGIVAPVTPVVGAPVGGAPVAGAAAAGTAAGAEAAAAAQVAAQAAATKDIEVLFKEREAAAAASARAEAILLEKTWKAETAAFQLQMREREAAERKSIALRGRLEKEFVTLQKATAIAPVQPVPGATAAAQHRLNVLIAQEAAARELATVARRAGFVSLAKDVDALRADTAALIVNARADKVAAAAATERAAAFRAATRATSAQGLSLIGLRGAALSAEAPFLAAAAATILFTAAVSDAAKLESQLAVFAATTGATADEMERVSETAIELGRDITLPGVGAQDAADALTELSKAGLSVEDSIDGARGVLQLATAANIDNAQATELAAQALNAFGLAGEEAAHVADVLANSANESQGSITDAGIALRQSAAVARQAGISLEETVAALTLFARAGLRGSDAGTSLRTALIRLINPSQKAQDIIDQLGLKIRKLDGSIDLNVFQQFTDVTRDLTAAQRDQALAIIFGQDAIRGAAILAREGRAGLQQEIVAVNQQGTAAEVAAARTSGLAGGFENLKNQASDLGLTFATILLPALTEFTNTAAGIISTANNIASTFINLGEKFKETAALFIEGLPPLKIDIGPIEIGGDEEVEKDGEDKGESFVRGFINTIKSQIRKDLVGAIAGATTPAGLGEPVANFFQALATTSIPEAREQLEKFIRTFDEVRGPTALNEIVIFLQEMQKEFARGDKDAQVFAKDIGVFIEDLQQLSRSPAEVNIRIPEALLRGEPGRLIGEATKREFLNAVEIDPREISDAFGLGAFVKDFGEQSDAGWGAFAAGAKRAALEAEQAVRSVSGRLNVLESELLDIEAVGGPGADRRRLANLREQEREAARAIALERGRLKPGAKTSPALREAQKARNTIQDQIQGILDQQARDAEEAKNEAQKRRDAADQALLDTLAPVARRLDTAALIAAGTEGLKDDIRVAKAQRANLLREIKIIDDSFNDRKQAAELISEKKQERIRLAQQIQADTAAIFTADTEAFEVRLGLAEAEGNIPRQIALLNQRIVGLDKLLAKLKEEGKKTDEVATEIANRRRQREDLQNEQIQQQIALGQSILDLTGRKNPLLKALNAAIKETQADIRAAKKAGQSTVILETELNTFLKQRKDVLEDAAEKAQGTTAFDLLTEAAETFRRTGGNLVTGEQPFAGPTGFTADIAQFLTTQRRGRPPSLAPPAADKRVRTENELIAAIKDLTQTFRGFETASGNKSTATVPRTRSERQGQRFFEAVQEKLIMEGGLAGYSGE